MNLAFRWIGYGEEKKIKVVIMWQIATVLDQVYSKISMHLVSLSSQVTSYAARLRGGNNIGHIGVKGGRWTRRPPHNIRAQRRLPVRRRGGWQARKGKNTPVGQRVVRYVSFSFSGKFLSKARSHRAYASIVYRLRHRPSKPGKRVRFPLFAPKQKRRLRDVCWRNLRGVCRKIQA